MKTDIIIFFSIVILWSTGIYIGSYYYTPPPKRPPCEVGWQIVRRFGFDIFLGNIPIEEARKQAGGNVLKWTQNITGECEPN